MFFLCAAGIAKQPKTKKATWQQGLSLINFYW